MKPPLLNQWLQLQKEHPPVTRPDLIEGYFEKKLNLLLELKKTEIDRIPGDHKSIDENINEIDGILKIIRNPAG
jgi:hypothetical protein